MKESPGTHLRGNISLCASMSVFVVICLCFAFFAGCGTSNDNAASSTGVSGLASPTATSTVPFANETMNFLTSEENAGQGVTACYLADVGSCMYQSSLKSKGRKTATREDRGAASFIGLTAKILLSIGQKFANADKPNFNTVTNQLNEMNAEIQQLNNEVLSIQLQLVTAQVDMTEYMANTYTTGNYVNNINNNYSAGGYNLIMFSKNAAALDPSPAPTPSRTLAYPIPTPTASPTATSPYVTATSVDQLNSWIPPYATPIMSNTGGMTSAINGIGEQIISNNLLIFYVNYLILNPPSQTPDPYASPSPNPSFSAPNAQLANAENAMQAYLLLEKYFLMLYTTQLKGLTVFQNADLAACTNDPQGAIFNDYLSQTFRPELYKEIVAFNQAVDYLVLNLADYRTTAQFASDNAYLSQGIARDTIYYQVLGRARFISAEILDSFGYNMDGLYGTIITPSKYTASGSTLESLGLNFSGAQSLALLKGAVQKSSIYPYTSWTVPSPAPSAFPAATRDNKWAVFDYNTYDTTIGATPAPSPNSYFPNDLSAGDYTITLNDGGSHTSPWNHTVSTLGQAKVQYYCPTGQVSQYPPTDQKTATNTMKFGFFSGRWNFGNELFSCSPFCYWYKSGAKFNVNVFNEGYYEFPNPALYKGILGEGTSWSTDYAAYLYPYTGNANGVEEQIYSMGSYPITYTNSDNAPWFTGYKIYLPFTQNTSGTSNSFIFNAQGGFNGTSSTSTKNYMLYYGIYSEKGNGDDNVNLVNESNKFGSSLSWQGIQNVSFSTNTEYDLKCTCYYANNPTGTFSQYLQWQVQLLYNGYVNIFN